MSRRERQSDRPFASKLRQALVALAIRRHLLRRPLLASEHYPVVLVEIDDRGVWSLRRTKLKYRRLAPAESNRQLPPLRVVIGATDLALMLPGSVGQRTRHHRSAGELHFGSLVSPIDG
jgi:hypothetical protein